MIQRSELNPWISLGSDVLIMSADQGRFFTLNGVASRVWELLEKPVEPDAIVAQLTAEYDVPRETCEQEIRDFLEKLRARGMLSDVAVAPGSSLRPDSPST